MNDGTGAPHRAPHGLPVADVGPGQANSEVAQPARRRDSAVPMDVGAQRVDDVHLVALAQQRSDRRPSDKPGPAGDENEPIAHWPVLSGRQGTLRPGGQVIPGA